MRWRGTLAALCGLFLGLHGGAAWSGESEPGGGMNVQALVGAPAARDAIARVTLAEAANQGDSGLLAVVFTIVNRLNAGRWGTSIDQVLNAPRQFEPVLRAGGDWRSLPVPRPDQRARIDTLLNLVLEGRLPDPTGGALYFQNPRIVAARAAAGQVSPKLVSFGGASPSAVIGDHTFYREAGGARARSPSPVLPWIDPIFVPRTPLVSETPAPAQSGARGIFVLADGQTVETRR